MIVQVEVVIQKTVMFVASDILTASSPVIFYDSSEIPLPEHSFHVVPVTKLVLWDNPWPRSEKPDSGENQSMREI